MWRERFRKVKDEFLEETARMREILREGNNIMFNGREWVNIRERGYEHFGVKPLSEIAP